MDHEAPPPTGAGTGDGWRSLYEASLDCVHCGLCLQTCPTYVETGREVSSPRGRVYLMRGAAEGRLPLAEALREEAWLCLGCRACETACPSGVRFGAMLEGTRAELERAARRRGVAARLERWGLRGLLPHRRRLRLAVDLLAGAQRLRLDRALRALLPRSLRERIDLLPRIPPRAQRGTAPGVVPAEGERRGRVAFFAGCLMPEFFGDVNAATIRVLARSGFEVVVPQGQACCGALHAHAGDADYARRLGRANLSAFESAGFDAVVTNSAGCGAALRETGERLPDDPRSAPFAARVRDVAELLDEAGIPEPSGRFEARVCYDDPCHLLHGQRVGPAPRRLLARIPGLELVDHDEPGACCGAAGTYNLTHPAMSRAVLGRKLDSLAAADPDVIATGNPGCLMQIGAGVRARGLRARVLHPVTLLDEALAGARPLAERRPEPDSER